MALFPGRGIIELEVQEMEKKFVIKMIENCFKQYGHNRESIPLSEEEYEQLYKKVMDLIEEEPLGNLYTIVNDVVYEYLTE
ncbi:hypothetical protein C0966_09015 [Bacillus methanolicus]|nr:hypothetical protein [Bacillus methanolicus]